VTIAEKLDRMDLTDAPFGKRAGVRFVQFLLGFFQQFKQDKVVIRAQGLAYGSLLAFVPLVAVLFALFSAFSKFGDIREKVQTMIFSQFLPARHDEIGTYIDQFTANTGKLGFLGFVALTFTAVLLLNNIEKNFNEVWAVGDKRKLVAKIMAYTSVIVFGTIFLGASVSISAKVQALLATEGLLEIGLLTKLYTLSFPLLFTFFAFLLMFKVIPHANVKIPSAAIGALVASFLFELGKALFAKSVASSAKYSVVYGALALLPIFLVWLYYVWIIILIGLEVTYTHQHFWALVANRVFKNPTGRERIGLALKFFSVIAQRFHKGEKPPTNEDLADEFLLPIEAVDTTTSRLIDREIVRKTVDSSDDEGLLPGRSLDSIKVTDVIQAVFESEDESISAEKPLEKSVDSLLENFSTAGYDKIGNLTILEYLRSIK
jgi:membrane protein